MGQGAGSEREDLRVAVAPRGGTPEQEKLGTHAEA